MLVSFFSNLRHQDKQDKSLRNGAAVVNLIRDRFSVEEVAFHNTMWRFPQEVAN